MTIYCDMAATRVPVAGLGATPCSPRELHSRPWREPSFNPVDGLEPLFCHSWRSTGIARLSDAGDRETTANRTPASTDKE